MAEQRRVQRKKNTTRPKKQTLQRASKKLTPQQRKRMQQKKRAQMLKSRRRIFFGGLLAVVLGVVLLVSFVTKSIHSKMAKTDTLTLTADKVIFEEVTSSEGLDKKDIATYANDVVTSFNKENGKRKVKLNKVKEIKDTLYVKTTYENMDVYSDFSGYEAYSGTVKGAQEAGYDFNTTFVTVKNGKKGEVVDGGTVTADSSLKVLIIRENATFKVNGTIKFVSDENTSVTDEKTVTAHSSDDDNASAALTYIIYK